MTFTTPPSRKSFKGSITLARLAPWLVLGALSCGGGQAAPPATPAGGEAKSESPEPGSINWDTIDKPARNKYMKNIVLPKMKELFATVNPKYNDMKCLTCHGPTAMHGTFEMPNPDLPKIPSDMAKFKEWSAKTPKMSEFMSKTVKPEMAKLLNMPEYDPAANKGFGCGNCHTNE